MWFYNGIEDESERMTQSTLEWTVHNDRIPTPHLVDGSFFNQLSSGPIKARVKMIILRCQYEITADLQEDWLNK